MMEDWLIGIIAGGSAILVILLVCILFLPIFGCNIGNTSRYAQTIPNSGSNNRTGNSQTRSRSATGRSRSTTAKGKSIPGSRSASKSRAAGPSGTGNKKGGTGAKKNREVDLELEEAQIVVEGPSTQGKSSWGAKQWVCIGGWRTTSWPAVP